MAVAFAGDLKELSSPLSSASSIAVSSCRPEMVPVFFLPSSLSFSFTSRASQPLRHGVVTVQVPVGPAFLSAACAE